jgi:exonuclease III
MAQLLKIAAWNVNGLCQHAQGIQIFIHTFNLDILLVSETHFTNKNYITTPNYNIYFTNHPEERVHGGAAIIIRQNIKHYVKAKYRHENIQATNIATEDNTGETTVSAICCPSKHHNKYDNYDRFFKTFGNRFIAGGDCNAKNTLWGSRLTTTKGQELHKVKKKT